jgi:hypothetical protein
VPPPPQKKKRQQQQQQAALEFVKKFANVEVKAYSAHQMFNVDDTGIFWRKVSV